MRRNARCAQRRPGAPWGVDEFEPFEPRLGRLRAPPARRPGCYLAQIVRATARAGGGGETRRGRGTGCARIGRGAGIGRLLGAGSAFGRARNRRGIVKTRLVRLRGKAPGAAHAHLRYLQRDGVQRDGSPGLLYSAGEDGADGRAFLERCEGDRHQFRLIVSAEDGAEYEDLKPLIRRFMARMETDLGTRLDWVAVDHRDTAHPHSHIILRGRDGRGENLVIARDYIARGMRERLAGLVTLDLGPRQESQVRRSLLREVSAERLTSIDRSLVRDSAGGALVEAGHRDAFRHALRAGRLRKLEALGLAEALGGGTWRLADGLEPALRRLGERGDIIRTIQRELTLHGLERAPADRVVHEHGAPDAGIVGRVLARGLSDELADRHYLLVDGIDGRAHHVDIGAGCSVDAIPGGAIVHVRPASTEERRSDRLVAAVAAANGGRYSAEAHLARDPSARPGFVEAHVRRLEALRRGGAAVERLEDGSWQLAPDHVEQARAFERRRARLAPVRVDILSPLPLRELPEREAATWLDEQLASGARPARDAGFGRELRSALALRRQWLLDRQLAEEADGLLAIRPGSLASLRGRELALAAARLGAELGLPFVPSGEGERIEGVLRRRVDLASGRFALVESGRQFTLVPWRPMLERHIGREVAGIARDDGISWTIGRGRKGPEIS